MIVLGIDPGTAALGWGIYRLLTPEENEISIEVEEELDDDELEELLDGDDELDAVDEGRESKS